MAETHQVVTKVWIAPGCIVCDSCENDCPEVFDVQEQTCVIRPPAMNAEFLKPLTPSIQVAAEGCPVDVIKFDLVEVPGPAPWAGLEEAAAAAATTAAPAGGAPVKTAAKAAAPMAPADPRWQGLLTTSRISPSLSAKLASTLRKPRDVIEQEEAAAAKEQLAGVVQSAKVPADAPPDMKLAMLAAAGAYRPAPTLGQRLRTLAAKAAGAAKVSRREVGTVMALVAGWGALAFAGLTSAAMFQDFFAPKVLKEPKKQIRVGRLEEYGTPGVNEQFKPQGIWLVNLSPDETKLVALSTECTHLGCIPTWLPGDQKFKCPCHGSGYYKDGINFEGPTPRPLERFAISRDTEGYVVVDMSKKFRQELGEWVNPQSYLEV